jgi:putative transport protein
MIWLAQTLRHNPDLALFLSMAVGYAIGQVRVGNFELGPVLGTLIAGLGVGQFVIPVDDAMKNVFFVMFLFALGYRTGPEFFRSLRSSGVPQLGLTIFLCVSALGITWAVASLFGFDSGTSAGLLAGAMTNSTALGTATSAAVGLGLDPAATARVTHSVASAYALTYVLGTALVVWFLPTVGPRLMRVNLRDASLAIEGEDGSRARVVNTAYREFVTRAYRLPARLEGRTVTEVEHLWPPDQRVVVARIRSGDAIIDAKPAMRLEARDIVAIAGRTDAIVGAHNPFEDEVNDRALLALPTISADLVLTNRLLSGQTLDALATAVAARGIFLIALRRGGNELPFARSTIVERGDVMTVAGLEQEVARVASEVGYAEYATTSTDMLLVAATIVVGGLLGIPAVVIGGIAVSLSVPVGVLLGGLVLGHLRSVNPRFGRIPDAAVWLFESLGLSAFLALVGLQAGPSLIVAIRESGLALIAAGVLIALLPHVATILVGHYLVRLNPAILLGLCAGAGTSAPALAAVEKAANSKVPSLGYGMACAIGNVLMAVWGTLIVLAGAG